MAFVEINPCYRAFLERHGLVAAEQFLTLPGPILCGHPDRNVARTRIGTGPDALPTFLKREHAVLRCTRLANAWAGFGLVSRSTREARLLQALHRAGVTAPQWLAFGEDDQGRAFLLVRELEGMLELRPFLRSAPAAARRQLARTLGAALAHMHETGFHQPDLYSKHLLVDADGSRVAIVDWQRGRHRDFVYWPQRYRDLAALHASLADNLATSRDRLACVRAYLNVAAPGRLPRRFRAGVIRAIARCARRLTRHRHIRELRQTTGDTELANVICLDGEALCVTPAAQAIWTEFAPAWLATNGRLSDRGRRVERAVVMVPGATQATLVRRRTDWPLSWLCSWLWGKRPTAHEILQAGLIFRLQRYGIETPRLLAFGQRHHSPWRSESFILTESSAGDVSLENWLTAPDTELPQRRRLMRKAGELVRRLHEAGCLMFPASIRGQRPSCPLVVHLGKDQAPALALGSIDGLVSQRRHSARAERRDLTIFLELVAPGNRTDRLRLLRGYLGHGANARPWSRLILGRRRQPEVLASQPPPAAAKAATALPRSGG